MITKQEVLDYIRRSIDTNELMDIYRSAHDRCKIVGRCLHFNISDRIKMKLEFQHRRPYAEEGTIIKINPSKVKVNFGMQGIWNVDKSCLEKV